MTPHRFSYSNFSSCFLFNFESLLNFSVFPSALKATADALKDEGFDCATYMVDISDKEQVYDVAKKVKQDIGKVDVLINNAGMVTCRTFLELPDKAIEKTYGVNILSHYWVSRYCLHVQQLVIQSLLADGKSLPS